VQCPRAILSSVACPGLLYIFSHYLINDTIFENSYKEHSREEKRARREDVIKENVMIHKKIKTKLRNEIR